MPVIPLPPGSGMPPIGETRFSPDEVVCQFASSITPQQIGDIAQRFGLTIVAQANHQACWAALFTPSASPMGNPCAR